MTAHWKIHLPGLRRNHARTLRSRGIPSPYPVLLLAVWLLATICLGLVMYLVLTSGVRQPAVWTDLPLLAANYHAISEVRL